MATTSRFFASTSNVWMSTSSAATRYLSARLPLPGTFCVNMNICWVMFTFQGWRSGVPQARYPNWGSSTAAAESSRLSASRACCSRLRISGLLASAAASTSARVIASACAHANKAMRTSECIGSSLQVEKLAKEDESDSQDFEAVPVKILGTVVKQIGIGNYSRSRQTSLFRIVRRSSNDNGLSWSRGAAAGLHIRHWDFAAIATHAFAAFMLVCRHFNAWYQAEDVGRYEPTQNQDQNCEPGAPHSVNL